MAQPCSHCSGSGWLDVARTVARHALPVAAGLAFGPAAAAATKAGVAMSGLGAAAEGAGKMVKLADGRKVKRLYDRDGKPVEIARRTRKAPAHLAARNAAVRELMRTEGLSLPQASAEVKARGLFKR